MEKVVIWGMGEDYEGIINQLKFEEYKGNLTVVALVSKKEFLWCEKRDGYSLIMKEELADISFDFLIVCSRRFYAEIEKEALDLGISRNHIINGQIFKMPLFDFSRYISLVRNPITIWSNDCWGGYVYHSLYLPFTSPFINTFLKSESYIKFIQDPDYYLERTLVCVCEGDIRKNQYPIAKIGDGDKEIFINFIHEYNYKNAEENWNRRKKRVNQNRIFVKLGLSAGDEHCAEYLNVFNRVPFPKICFYSGSIETDKQDIVYLKRFEWYVRNGGPTITLNYTDYTHKLNYIYKDIDILKLLNSERVYHRESF